LKDCCYGKLVWLIKNNLISCSDSVASKRYINAAAKTISDITVQNEFVEEARVIRWVDAPNGKKRLMGKKEMNRELGRGRSMDLLDACSMRMYPLLNYQDGTELESSRNEYVQYEEDKENGDRIDIYDETQWY
jgi:tRNA splicing endonuclease